MRKLFKLMAAAVLVLLLVVGAGVLAVYLLFDPNDYREEIATALSEETGRDVQLAGELGLSVFPKLAVRTEGVTVSNAPGFEPATMLRFERVAGSIDLLALLQGELRIGTIEVIGLDVNLAVRGDGVTNWDDLVETMSAADSPDASAEPLPDDGGDEAGTDIDTDIDSGEVDLALVSFDGVEIRDARVVYEDAASGSTYRLNDLDFTLSATDLSRPLPMRLAFDATADPGGMAVKADIALSVLAESDGQIVRIADLDVDSDVQMEGWPAPVPVTLATESLVLDFAANTLALAPTRLGLGELRGELALQGSGPSAPLSLTGELELESFAPAKVLPAFGVEAPETTDPEALKSVALSAALAVDFESAAVSELSLRVDDTTLSGSIGIANFANGALRFDLIGDSMNLDRYLPPAEDAEVADDAGDALAESALPVDLIKGIDAAGRLRFGRLTLGDLPFEDLDLGLTVANSRAQLQPIKATVLEGRYAGDVRIDASGSTPRLSLDERVEGLNIGTLASLLFEQDNIEGELGGRFRLAGTGTTLADIRSSLDGEVAFELKDGALRGTDLWYQIRRARALFKRETPPPAPAEARTSFSSIRGTAAVSGGVATNDDLFAELPFLQLTGAGAVNLGDGTVDYDLDARVLERPEFLTDATEDELDAYTEAVIPLKIEGPIAAPAIAPDIERMVRDAAEQRLEEEADRLLDRLLGDDEDEEEEDVEDALRKRLRDIF